MPFLDKGRAVLVRAAQVAGDGCSSGDVRESYELTLTEVLYTPLALTSRGRQVVGTGYLYLALDSLRLPVVGGVVPWVMPHWSWYATPRS